MADRRFPIRPCAVCNGVLHRLIYRQRFETPSGGHLLDGYSVVSCEKCGFCFADDVPDQAAFDCYYRDMSKYEHAERGGRQTDHDLARFKGTAAALCDFVPNLDSRIVEVGCRYGRTVGGDQRGGLPFLSPASIRPPVAPKLFDGFTIFRPLQEPAMP